MTHPAFAPRIFYSDSTQRWHGRAGPALSAMGEALSDTSPGSHPSDVGQAGNFSTQSLTRQPALTN
jgi:hypothetical protein